MRVGQAAEIIESMLRAVPARQERLDEDQIGALRELTNSLVAAKPDAAGEYARFLGIKQRGLCLPQADLATESAAQPSWSPAERGASARR